MEDGIYLELSLCRNKTFGHPAMPYVRLSNMAWWLRKQTFAAAHILRGQTRYVLCTEAWLPTFVDKLQQLIASDSFYVLGVFNKDDGNMSGMVISRPCCGTLLSSCLLHKCLRMFSGHSEDQPDMRPVFFVFIGLMFKRCFLLCQEFWI